MFSRLEASGNEISNTKDIFASFRELGVCEVGPIRNQNPVVTILSVTLSSSTHTAFFYNSNRNIKNMEFHNNFSFFIFYAKYCLFTNRPTSWYLHLM